LFQGFVDPIDTRRFSVKIIVLCKQVPDTESKIKLLADGSNFDEEGIKWVLNPYDEFAVEEALKIKEAGKAEKVTVLGLGPDRVMEALRTAMAMGADDAIHVSDPAFVGGDSYATAKTIAKALEGGDFGLILAGKQAADDDAFSVPGMLAQMLGIPQVNVCSKIEVEGDKVKAYRDVEGGAKEVVEASTPVMLTTTKGLNEPRYASLPGIMKAKRKPVAKKDLAALGLSADEVGAKGAKTKIYGWELPKEREAGKVFKEGELADNVKKVVQLLREEAKVI